MISCSDPETCDILDVLPNEPEDLRDISTVQADLLLSPAGEGMVEEFVHEHSATLEADQGNQSQPELERGFSSMELEEDQSEAGAPSTAAENSTTPALHNDHAADGTLLLEDVELSRGVRRTSPASNWT